MHNAPLVTAVLGNGRMLGNLNEQGELTHLYWPHIDYPNHVQRVLAGLHIWGKEGVHWLSHNAWQHSQRYTGDAPIVETVAESHGLGLKVTHTDFVTAGQDTLVRRYQILNKGLHAVSVSFVYYVAFHMGESARYNSIFWEPESSSLCCYRRDACVVVGGARGPAGYRVGPRPYDNSAWNDAQDGHLSGGVIEMNDVDGALTWESGSIEPGGTWQITVFHSCGYSREAALTSLNAARGQGAGTLEKAAKLAWNDWLYSKTPDCKRYGTDAAQQEIAENLTDLDNNTQVESTTATANEVNDRLWRRSLVVMRLLTDETGAIIAAPEFDPERRWSGGYGFCWGRDAAYVVYALNVAGRHNLAAEFYRWAVRVQEPSGVWYQRYWVTGELGPSWGLIQIDETGSILWGLWKHLEMTSDTHLLHDTWPAVERAATFLTQFRDAETGLLKPSWDLWEERLGVHTYSCAAVYGGLQGAAHLARMLGQNELAQTWNDAACGLKEAVLTHCYSQLHGRFLRCVSLRVPEWSAHDPALRDKVRTVPPASGYLYPEYTVPEDATVDTSLLGLCVPFNMLPANDPRMMATAAAIERDLTRTPAGGVMRYTGDHYRGGNPWILCTLWLAQYYQALGDTQRAHQYFDWSVQHRTALDLLPEQVDRNTGAPAWVVPLTWSHAMFILTAAKLGCNPNV